MSTWEITGRLKYSAEGNPIEQAFFDGNGEPANGLEAIFPIVSVAEDVWQPIGTGFFISNNGLFATAKHVLIDSSSGEVLPSLVGIQLVPNEARVIIRDVIKVCPHPTADVAVAFLKEGEKRSNKFFALSREDPAIGEKIATIAFPKSTSRGSAKEFLMEFSSAGIVGILDEVHPEGRDSTLLPSKCFRTSMNILGGASGGPVANENGGNIFGINSTGYEGQNISYISSTSDLLDITIPDLFLPDGSIHAELSVRELVERELVIYR